MKSNPTLKIIGRLVILAFITAIVLWVVAFSKFWISFHRERAALTPVEQERLSYDLMAAMFNASQTNWTMTVTITPRTNLIEKP